jgi:hypothetical protein
MRDHEVKVIVMLQELDNQAVYTSLYWGSALVLASKHAPLLSDPSRVAFGIK